MTVLIEINNCQLSDGETNRIKDTVTGEYISDENGFSLSYADKNLGGNTLVTVSGGDFVSVCRADSGFNTEMIFEKGRKRPFVYATPYGEILLETETKTVTSFADENGGFVEFEYEILSDGEIQSHNRMKISFSEEKDV